MTHAANPESTAPSVAVRKAARRRRFDRSAAWLLAPALIILVVFRLVPMFVGAWLSFTRWSGIGDPKFVGLQNYQLLLSDPDLLTSLGNNAKILAALLVGILLPLVVAVLLNNRIFGWKFFRIAFFLPVVLSPLVLGIFWAAVLRSDGPVNGLLNGIGLGFLAHQWLADPVTALPWMAAILIWATFGTGVILFMAGLAGVNPDLYDAAKADGANWLATFRHITIPELSTIIQFWAVQLLIFSFTGLFPFVYTLTAGGPGHTTSVVEFQLYQAAFASGLIGYGSAIGMAILVLVFTLLVVAFWWVGRRAQDAL
jgi:ABC-type sugar transport system permease subunit